LNQEQSDCPWFEHTSEVQKLKFHLPRFDILTHIANEYPTSNLILCTVYSFLLTASCVGVSFACVVRIFCLRNIALVEELIGERVIILF
jgi:hypothetical protein